ncbi:MAG: hypothetical protein KDC38_10710, partial [Planctomycetes bacterium]|nr:hypothetical protein [Planctomycetota bacterium]
MRRLFRWRRPVESILVATSLLVLSFGCDTGRRHESSGIPVVIDCSSDQPYLFGSSSETACPGEELTLYGLNFSPVLEDNRVTFQDPFGATSIEALVLESIDNGPHPVYHCRDTSLVVLVPPAARTGVIEVRVRAGSSAEHVAGSTSFVGCPELLGFVVGTDGDPFLTVDSGYNLLTDRVQLYGTNLDRITETRVLGPDGQSINATATSGGLTGSTYTIASTLDVATVTLDPNATIIPTCETYYIQLSLIDSTSGSPVESNSLIIPVRTQFSPTDSSDLPGTITGCSSPSGIQRGVVPIHFDLAMDPARASYDVVLEYLDSTALGGWSECAGVDAGQHELRATGLPSQVGAFPALVGGGHSHTFLWDTVANGIGYPATGSGDPFVTRVRFRLENISPGSAQPCPPSSRPEALFESATIIVDNPLDDTGLSLAPAAREVTILELFEDALHLDDSSPTDVTWDGEGSLIGGRPTASPPWATGTVDVVCGAISAFSENAGIYVFNTTTGSVTDVSDPASAVPLFSRAATDPPGVFAFRSWLVEDGAKIVVVGSEPLRVAIAGDGTTSLEACRIDGEIDLDGESGSAAVVATSGVGGLPGAGGGAGGDGGTIIPGGVDTIEGDVAATRGGNDGGHAGQNLTFLQIGDSSTPKGGPGGGGGGRTRGGAGATAYSAELYRLGTPGRGGPARGDEGLIHLVGGAGGGGGGGVAYRSSGAAAYQVHAGSGGGGGGGALEVIVNGSIGIGGSIHARGGSGAASLSPHSGPGGGGSGGNLRIAATGEIEVSEVASIDVSGGSGGSTVNQFGGDGSAGRVRLEAAGIVVVPGIGDFGGLVPPIGSIGVTAGVVAPGFIDSGSGDDGALNLAAALMGTYVVDTDTGIIAGPIEPIGSETANAYRNAMLMAGIVATRASDLEWNFTELSIGPGRTLRAIGTKPLVIRVRGDCAIDGDGIAAAIDVSGFDGGVPDVVTDALSPTAGVGGEGGPGGGDGGAGGRASSASSVVDGESPPLDFLPASWLLGGRGGGTVLLPAPVVSASEGGRSIADISTAGAGGGGGNTTAGQSASDAFAASGGSRFGASTFVDPLTGTPIAIG